jgi:hypothetical protein
MSEGQRAPRMTAPSNRQSAPRAERERPSRDVERRSYRSVEPRREREQRSRSTERARELQQRDRAVERRQQEQRQRDRAAERKQQEKQEKGVSGRAPDRKAQPDRTAQPAQRHEQIRSARQELTSDQRTRLRTSFHRNRGDRLTRVKFPHRIGHRIPRHVRLWAIPAAVLAIVPAYAYYRYAWIDDDICIVDPATYEVVDVIDESGGPAAPGSRPQVAELQLSPAERAIVLDGISPNFPPAEVRLRLALGAEIPRSVELHSFPDSVLDRVRRLAGFRFIVVESDVVIIDPRDRSIALVVERR